MKLIIGLGNPGQKYKNTRHNIGHLVAGELVKLQVPKDFIVKRTNVFMNDSGNFVKKLVDQYHIEFSNLWVIHDDLDIPLGSYKIQNGKGPKLHNGINSIEQELEREDFWRVRVGVDSRDPESRISGEEYVLQDFSQEERGVLDTAIAEICKKLATS